MTVYLTLEDLMAVADAALAPIQPAVRDRGLLESALARASYLPDRGLSTALDLSLKLEKPLLLEGEAGVGKTEAAKSIATALGARLEPIAGARTFVAEDEPEALADLIRGFVREGAPRPAAA